MRRNGVDGEAKQVMGKPKRARRTPRCVAFWPGLPPQLTCIAARCGGCYRCVTVGAAFAATHGY